MKRRKDKNQGNLFDYLAHIQKETEKPQDQKIKERIGGDWPKPEHPAPKKEEKVEEPLINPKTCVFNRGKHEGQPIWNVTLVDADYISWLYYESEIDEESRAEVEKEIENNPDKYSKS